MLRTYIASLSAVSLLAGCAVDGEEVGAGAAAAPVLLVMAPLPDDGGERIDLTGRAEGRLVRVGSCLGLRTSAGSETQLVWPAGTRLVGKGGGFAVRNEAADIDVVLGDRVVLGGGAAASPADLKLQAPIPAGCAGTLFTVSTARTP